MNKEIITHIKEKIKAGNSFQPLLFVGENLEIINQEIEDLIHELFSDFEADKNYYYKISDNNEKIKITQMRDFISKGDIKSSFAFQVFFIENIARATTESANSALKFLEEPGIGNIIFLSSKDESGILETILSRVQVISLGGVTKKTKNQFFSHMIETYLQEKNTSIFQYFFQDKRIEKQEYIDFLETFLLYIQEHLILLDLIEDIEKSITLIQKNNVLPKYEIDKLLLKI